MSFPSQQKGKAQRVDVYYCIQRLRKFSNDVFAMVIDLQIAKEKMPSRAFSFPLSTGQRSMCARVLLAIRYENANVVRKLGEIPYFRKNLFTLAEF